jgi:hypothetical protein
VSILGIIASSRLAAVGDFQSIATATGTGSSGVITFSSISGTYAHLQLRYIARSTAGTAGTGGIQFTANGDSTSGNYSFHRLTGNGTSAAAYGQTGLDYIGQIGTNGNAAYLYAVGILDILDYTSTNKGKTFRMLTGSDYNNTLGGIALQSQGWFATPAAITSLTLTSSIGNFDTNSHFALYGIKGA